MQESTSAGAAAKEKASAKQGQGQGTSIRRNKGFMPRMGMGGKLALGAAGVGALGLGAYALMSRRRGKKGGAGGVATAAFKRRTPGTTFYYKYADKARSMVSHITSTPAYPFPIQNKAAA